MGDRLSARRDVAARRSPLRDRARGCGGLLLAYPNTDLPLATDSMQALGHGWSLDADSLRWPLPSGRPPG
jgi:hypothetical protein